MATRKSVMKIARMVFPLGLGLSIIFLWLQGNQSNYLLGIFLRFLSYFLFVGLLIFGTILITLFGPPKHIYRMKDWEDPNNQYKPKGYDVEKYNILFDSHFHTIWSDGKLTIEQGIKWHLAMGFNAFAVTDHGIVKNKDEILRLQEKYKDEIIIIPGIEIDSFNGHLNVIGYQNWKEILCKKLNNVEEIKDCIEEAHKQGAIVTWNHYPWSYGGDKPRYKNMPKREEVLSWGVDFIEASNWDDDVNTIDMESYEFCKKYDGIAPIVGSDVHSPDKDKLWAWTLMNVREFSPRALMKELRKKNTEVLFEPNGIPYPTKHTLNPRYQAFKSLYDIGDMFISLHQGSEISNLNWKGISSWLAFILAIFGILEFSYYLFL